MGQAGKENQTPTIGNQTPTKDGVFKQPSQAAKKKTLQAGRENQAHRVDIQAPNKDGVYEQPSQKGKKKAMQAGKENQTPTNGIQTPTKDGVCKQPSQAAKKKTLQAGRESQAHTMLFVKHCRDSVGRNSTPLHLAPSFINQAQTTTSCNKRWEAQTGTRSSYPWGCLARDSNNYNVN